MSEINNNSSKLSSVNELCLFLLILIRFGYEGPASESLSNSTKTQKLKTAAKVR